MFVGFGFLGRGLRCDTGRRFREQLQCYSEGAAMVFSGVHEEVGVQAGTILSLGGGGFTVCSVGAYKG